jgi:hypothetical protein
MNNKTTTIEIDLDVYQAIVNYSNYINEPANDVLKRLLSLQNEMHPLQKENQKTETGGLMVKGVFLKSGLKLRKYYKGKLLEAAVRDGYIEYNNKKYTSPSAAAVNAANRSVNGWKFWEYYDENNNKWKLLDTLQNK